MSGRTWAIVGATGAVGRTFLEVLAEREAPVGRLRLFASSRSAGKRLSFRGEEIEVEDLETADVEGIDVAFFSAGAAVSKAHAARFVEAGALVVDNSSAFRMDPEVPLVVPEVNAHEVANRPKGIVANPNCSTILLVVPLRPIHQAARVRTVRVATYQAISGAGARALAELDRQSREVLAGREPVPEVLPFRIAFNVFSHNSPVGEDGYNEEERKMRNETKKILGDDKLEVAATCIRVPVHRAHCEAVYVETERPLSPEEAREILSHAPGVVVLDDREANRFPTPLVASGRDEVFVGRIRRDTAGGGLAFFLAGDQLRKGAATNAVQIAEAVLAEACHLRRGAAS